MSNHTLKKAELYGHSSNKENLHKCNAEHGCKKEEGIATICTTVKLPKTFLSQKGLETEKAQEKKLKQV